MSEANTQMEETSEIVVSEEADVQAKKTSAIKIFRIVSTAVFATFLGVGFLFAALNPLHSKYTSAQVRLAINSNALGLIFLALPFLIRKLFRIHISFALLLPAWMFVLCHIIGETFLFYERLAWFDKTLHTLSSVLIFFGFFGIARSFFFSKNYAGEFAASLVFAIAATFALALLWELAEFTIDSLMGTNMQRFVPKEFYNGGNSFSELGGTAEEIAAFYASPSGYKFALMDTMLDCICCLSGTIFGMSIAIIVNRKNTDFLKKSFWREPKASIECAKAPTCNSSQQ